MKRFAAILCALALVLCGLTDAGAQSYSSSPGTTSSTWTVGGPHGLAYPSAATAGQVLTASSSTIAAWSTPSTIATTLVYQPSGTAGPGVFTSWPALVTAAGLVQGPLTVFFDGQFNGNACTIPAGAWSFNRPFVEFDGGPNASLVPGALVTVTCADGATLSGINRISGVVFASVSSSPVFTNPTRLLELTEGARLTASAAAPMISITGMNEFVLSGRDVSQIGDGSNAVMSSSSSHSQAAIFFCWNATANAGSITGSNTLVVLQTPDSINNSSAPTQLNSIASVVSYNDSLVAPTTGATQVQGAIDWFKTHAPTFPAGLGTGYVNWTGTSWASTALPTSLPPSGSAGGSLAGSYPNPTIAASGVTAGTYGSTTQSAVCTFGSDGRATSCSDAAIAFPTSLPPDGTAGGRLAGTYPNPTLAASGVGAATYGSATQVPVCAVSTDGTISSCVDTPIAIPPSQVTAGTNGQLLMTVASAAAWTTPTGDVTFGATGATTVGALSGPTVIPITSAPILAFAGSISSPIISQSVPGSGVSGGTLTVEGQGGGSGTTGGGELILRGGIPGGSGAKGEALLCSSDLTGSVLTSANDVKLFGSGTNLEITNGSQVASNSNAVSDISARDVGTTDTQNGHSQLYRIKCNTSASGLFSCGGFFTTIPTNVVGTYVMDWSSRDVTTNNNANDALGECVFGVHNQVGTLNGIGTSAGVCTPVWIIPGTGSTTSGSFTYTMTSGQVRVNVGGYTITDSIDWELDIYERWN